MNCNFEPSKADVCYHEAAHAVFDYHAGLTIYYITAGAVGGHCVTDDPENPSPSQAIELAAGRMAGCYAQYRHRYGRTKPPTKFEDFQNAVETAEKEAAHLQELGFSSSEVAEVVGSEDRFTVMRLLKIAVGWLDPPAERLEEVYEAACTLAADNVELWWSEIMAIAERLQEMDAGTTLPGAKCVEIIEATSDNQVIRRLGLSRYRPDFEAKALRLLKTVRASLIYLCLAVRWEEESHPERVAWIRAHVLEDDLNVQKTSLHDGVLNLARDELGEQKCYPKWIYTLVQRTLEVKETFCKVL